MWLDAAAVLSSLGVASVGGCQKAEVGLEGCSQPRHFLQDLLRSCWLL
jgi:hypothetical protein